jgi:hypothetical protein
MKINWHIIFYFAVLIPLATGITYLFIRPQNHEEQITFMVISVIIITLVTAAEFILIGIPGRKNPSH